MQGVETARNLGNVALGKAGIAIASDKSYMNLDAQGALVSRQAAYIARQQAEMFQMASDMLGAEDEEIGTDGKKKKRKKTQELTA